ncbi:unnamed protein product [Colias eurytheme]|nr:unnamed protein product [Colias eurytheme]
MVNKQMCLELIKLFKSHRLLWDPTNTHFYHKELKEQAWKDISCKMKLPVNEVKKKITNLRGVLRKERYRCREFNKSDGVPYESKWFAFKHLSFLEDIRYHLPMDKKNEPSSTATLKVGKTEPESDSNAENEKEEEEAANNSESDMPLASATVWMQGHETPEEPQQTTTRKRKTVRKVIRRAKKLKSEEYFYKPDNTYDAFGRLVASELRKYDNHTLAYVKKAIMDIIFQADTGSLPAVSIEYSNEY